MPKAALMALITGIFLGAGIVAWVFGGRVPGDLPAGPAAVRATDPGDSAAAREIDRLERDLAAAKAALEEVRRERDLAGAGPKSVPRSRPTTWQDIVGEVARLRALTLDRGGFDTRNPDVLGLIRKLILFHRALADELGIPEEQVPASSEGLPALALAYLDSLDPPADASLRARLETAVADSRAQWAEFMKSRDSMVPIEAALESRRIQDAFGRSLESVWSESQAVGWGLLKMSDEEGRPRDGLADGDWSDGGRKTFLSRCTNAWVAKLSLLPGQQQKLAPIVAEYAESLASLKDTGTSPDVPPAYAAYSGAALMMRAQKRMVAELSLSEEQKKALANWTSYPTYSEAPAGEDNNGK